MTISKRKIFQQLQMLAVVLGEAVTEQRLNAYVEMLPLNSPNFNSERFFSQLNTMARVFKRFPSYPEFEAHVIGRVETKDEGQIIAGKIVEAISRFGRYQADEAKVFLGAIGWTVVKGNGGWETLCSMETSELNILKAQMREMAKSFINLDKAPVMPDKPLLNTAKNELKALTFEVPNLLEE